jgi:hypothetical protein
VNNRTPVEFVCKTDRLASIEMADERTDKIKRELERNIGAEIPGEPRSTGSPHGDGNSVIADRHNAPAASFDSAN